MIIKAVLLFVIAAVALINIYSLISLVKAQQETKRCKQIIADIEDQLLELHRLIFRGNDHDN